MLAYIGKYASDSTHLYIILTSNCLQFKARDFC